MDCTSEILLCQPDSGKGCSVCCGLFNFKDISRESLTSFLQKPIPSPAETEDDQYGTSYLYRNDIRDVTSHICPYQGFLSEGKPGCRIHPAVCGKDNRDHSLFGKTICDRFLCPAHRILDNREKIYLTKYVRDWYCYSIAIIDPGTFSWIIQEITRKYSIKDCDDYLITDVLENALSLHAKYMNSTEQALFYYSVPEYISHRELFWAGAETTSAENERKEIRRIVSILFE